ncbi:MAG: MarR family transcriptional regulator [Sphingomonadaceae bacterium]|nr:MarR family transcriptional regulator [Sphingomonadaceae bacterium]
MHTDAPDHLGVLVHDVARLMRHNFEVQARALGTTRQQWRTLIVTARCAEPPTQAELAERLDVERITLCRMVDRLADAGLVERRADPRDRRVWRIHLLPAAQPIIEQVGELANQLENELMASLGSVEGAALRRGLEKLRDVLRRPPGERERDVA